MTHEDREHAILCAYLALMARHPFDAVSMHMVANEAGVHLAHLRATFASEEAMLEAFARNIDCAMLDRYVETAPTGGARARLIHALLARLHVLVPYKSALRSLLAGAAHDPALLLFFNKVSLDEHKWSLIVAGLNPRGARGRDLAEAVSFAFVAAVPVWLDETDTAFPRTRTALERALLHDDAALAPFEMP